MCGVHDLPVDRLEAAIVKEAEVLRNPREAGGAKSVIAIKDNEDRAKELKVGHKRRPSTAEVVPARPMQTLPPV
jgi:hypothetical protein